MEGIDNTQQIDAAILDFTKAFDCVLMNDSSENYTTMAFEITSSTGLACS